MNTVVSVFGVEPRRIGGNENFARELSSQLAERGWQSVLCFLTPPPPDVRTYLELPNVSIEILEESWHPNAKAASALRKILRKHRPQILHLHFVGFIGLLPWVGRTSFIKRIFFTDQGSHPSDFVASRAPFWKRSIVRAINLPLTKVICVSNYNKNCLTTLGVLPDSRFERIYNSVDFARAQPSVERARAFRERYQIPSNRKIVTQVSWIIPEKGIHDLIEAMSLVLKEDPNVQLVLVGDGAYRDEYSKLAAERGIDDHLTWTGLVQDPFGEGVYDAADIVCQVSRWQEAFGWVIAEAMAFEKPVIGTTVGGIPEIIEDGKTGYLVSAGAPDQIAERLLDLLRDEPLRRQMGRDGKAAALAKFDLKTNVRRLLELYQISTNGN